MKNKNSTSLILAVTTLTLAALSFLVIQIDMMIAAGIFMASLICLFIAVVIYYGRN